MMPDPLRRGLSATRLLFGGLLLARLLLAGCRSDAGITVATSSATPTPPAAKPTAQSARVIDFNNPAVIGPILDHFFGGQIPRERITYADLTGDHVDDAIAVVESGGTGGDLGAAVFSAEDGRPKLLGYIDRGGRVELRLAGPVAGVIVVTQGSYAPADPQCCPTKVREIVQQWDGKQFAVVTDHVIDNPQR